MRKLRLFLALGLLMAVSAVANAAPVVLDLSTLTGNVGLGAPTEWVLTGELKANVKITLLNGVNVTLDNVRIIGKNNDAYKWAGLTCAGDATITLKGENTVTGFEDSYPGIFVPYSSTLKIYEHAEGGSLFVRSNNRAAGIGGGYNLACGNIEIYGGRITAQCGVTEGSGFKAAGIGSGYNAGCGAILIKGGIIKAVGGSGAAAIGGGEQGTIGNVWVDEKVIAITALKGAAAPCSIGKGYNGSSYNVTVLGVDYGTDGMTSDFAWDSRKVYTEFVSATGVLTYYFDEKMATRSGKTEEYTSDPAAARFKGYSNSVTKAVIDPSMKTNTLTSMKSLFCGGKEGSMLYSLSALTEIEGLENLNTSNVTDMEQMFYSCHALTALDMTVIDMSKAANTTKMFAYSAALKTIYCDNDWTTYASMGSGDKMFLGCTAIVGGHGQTYNSSYTDKSYARPDKVGTPGYFTSVIEIINGEQELLGWDRDAITKVRNYINNSFSAPDLVSTMDGYIAAINAALANTGTTYVASQEIKAARVQADKDFTASKDAYIKLVADNAKARIDYWADPDDGPACKAIIANAKLAADTIGNVWSGAKSINQNLNDVYDLGNWVAEDNIEKLLTQRIADKKAALTELASEMTKLYAFANGYLQDKTMLAPLQQAITEAYGVLAITTPTQAELNTGISNAQTALTTAIDALMTEAKIELCNVLDLLLQPGDSQACLDIVDQAKSDVNALAWDNASDVDANTTALTTAANNIYDATVAALNAQRHPTGIEDVSHKSEIINHKLMIDGQLYILRDGMMYDMTGKEVK